MVSRPQYTDKYELIEADRIADNPDVYSFLLHAPKIAEDAKPGQIILVKCGSMFLRRPFGICEILRDCGIIRFCFEVRGEGTEILASAHEGDYLDVIGPFGNGFPDCSSIPKDNSAKKLLLVGGGIGVFPLLSAASPKTDALLAFRSADRICLVRSFRDLCENVYISTDDGSEGYAGYAVSLLKELDIRDKYSTVYVCGPLKMMKTIALHCMSFSVPCYVSMEQRMGCGVGACLGCACEVLLKNGEKAYKRVCADGPVFRAEEISWDAV